MHLYGVYKGARGSCSSVIWGSHDVFFVVVLEKLVLFGTAMAIFSHSFS